jgi:hypothetical protein
MATIKAYKAGFRTYANGDVPVSRKPVSLGRAVQQRDALIPGREKIRNYSLSDSDIKKIIPTLKVISYPDLHKYTNIDDALDEKGRLMILYLTTDINVGHWTCLLKSKDGKKLEFFDSYGGYKPDQESEWLNKGDLEKYHQDTSYLSELLKHSPYKIVYNRYPFQSEKPGVATCGRHAATRLYFKHLTLPQYTQMIINSGMAPDDFVSNFTYKMIGK